jgi:hypothetical protein
MRFLGKATVMHKGLSVGSLRYGGRRSDKLVRCYAKRELGVFRVELELHSSLLRSHNIVRLGDLPTVVNFVYPKHLQFVDFEWTRLKRHLDRKMGGRAPAVFSQARKRAASIGRVARFLRNHGVVNIHRFLLPMAKNEVVKRALEEWARRFARQV